jgi:hypothetical protein
MMPMDGNPYARMVALIRGESGEQTPTGETAQAGLGASPCKMRLGRVTRRAPLRISVAGIEQPAQALRINERLTKGARWQVKLTGGASDFDGLTGSLSGPVTCGGEGCSPELDAVTGGALHGTQTTVDEATVEQLEIDLEVGDQVLLLTEDDQIFYILMKVVVAT